MNFVFEILQKNPEVGTLLIATTFTAVGFICKTLIDTFLENKRYKKEIKKAYWTEKLNAAKKTSEFYYDHLELIGLMIHNIDIQLNQEIPGPLHNSMQETLKLLSQRNVNPKSFEHHHIHIFYDVDTKLIDQLNTESFVTIQKMEEIELLESDSPEVIQEKLNKVRGLLLELKMNHEKKKNTYKDYLKRVRKDILEFAK